MRRKEVITKDKMSRYLDKFFLLVLCKIRLKGLFIFYEVGGGGLVGYLVGHAKRYGFKGGPAKKIWCVKGGSPKKLPLSLVVTASVIMQTSVAESQKWCF